MSWTVILPIAGALWAAYEAGVLIGQRRAFKLLRPNDQNTQIRTLMRQASISGYLRGGVAGHKLACDRLTEAYRTGTMDLDAAVAVDNELLKEAAERYADTVLK